MKKFLKLAAVAAIAALGASSVARADWAPEGPIKLLIAFAAGGGADTQARLIAAQIEADLGWQVIPENVTGKGGLNTAVALKDMPADGTAIGMIVTETLGYNAVAAGNPVSASDFTGLTTTAGFQMGIVSKTSKGWNDFGDVIAAAQAGEEIVFGTMSPRLSDLAFLLGEANGVEFNIVQVRGGRAVMDGVNADDMDLGWMAGIQAKGVMAGDLVNLASGIGKPLAVSPDAPLTSAFGLEYAADGYFALVGPAGMPDDAREALTAAIVNAITADGTDVNALLNRAFGGPTVISGADLDAKFAADATAAGSLLAAVGN